MMRSSFRTFQYKVDEWIVRRFIVDEIDGIRICECNLDETDDEDFLECVRSSLRLVNEKDPRRYARIKKHLQYIINQELMTFAVYIAAYRGCQMDFGRLDYKHDPEWCVWLVAAVLVHEATHGVIDSRGIKYTADQRAQIERICRAEENRFLELAPEELREKIIVPFNPDDWSESWNRTRGQAAREILKRVRESLRRSRDAAR